MFRSSIFQDVNDVSDVQEFKQCLLRAKFTLMSSMSSPSEGQVMIVSCSEGERGTLDVPLQRFCARSSRMT